VPPRGKNSLLIHPLKLANLIIFRATYQESLSEDTAIKMPAFSDSSSTQTAETRRKQNFGLEERHGHQSSWAVDMVIYAGDWIWVEYKCGRYGMYTPWT
jgi:hypothetical protein